MNFSGNHTSDSQDMLPQFSELASRRSPVSTPEFTICENVQSHAAQTSLCTTTANQRQLLINSSNKYPSPLTFAWSDSLMQLCEKQNIPAFNFPNLNQNNTLLGLQSNTLPANILPTFYVPSTSQDIIKEELDLTSDEQKSSDTDSQTQLQQQSAVVAEYLQKLQATTLPLTLQQLIRAQTEHMKREKTEEEKLEHIQSNILNIPSVPVFRNNQLQNGGSFTHSDHTMMAINPADLNVHMDNNPENENNLQSVVKLEQQIQTDEPKIEKKSKFRAKIGEIKLNVTSDGSTLYCCPECTLAFPNKMEIEQHIQAHIQERKYQCKECGAMLKRKEHLDQHMRGHSDERPFKCPVCQKAFKRNEHLTRHYVIHSGDKNFSCNICHKAFSRKDHLNKHIQTHTGIRKNKTKRDSYFIDQKDLFDRSSDVSVFKPEMNSIFKESCPLKQEMCFQHLHSLPKDSPTLLHTFSSLKEQTTKERQNVSQQQNVDMNEILTDNTRYPS